MKKLMRVAVVAAVMAISVMGPAEAQQACGTSTTPVCTPNSVMFWDPVTTNADGTPITDLGGYDVLMCPTTPCTMDTTGVVKQNVGIPSNACAHAAGPVAPPCIRLGDLPNLGGPGTKNFSVDAYDTTGNVLTSSNTLSAIYSDSVTPPPPGASGALALVQGTPDAVGVPFTATWSSGAGAVSYKWWATFTSSPNYELLVSTSADRSNPVALNGYPASGNVYVFISPESGVTQVRFFLDDPTMTGAPRQTEGIVPFDFAGTDASGLAIPFDTTSIGAGSHTITAAVDSAGGTQVVSATFNDGSSQLSGTTSGTSTTFKMPYHPSGAVAPGMFCVRSVSPGGESSNACAQFTVPATILQPVAITTTSLPTAALNHSYSNVLVAAGGQQPYTWSMTSGALLGLSLNPIAAKITS
jgi:hypothetical protein